MRCSCKECGTYMIQAESDHLGCVCPDCGYRCNDCLGTDTVVSRERLKDLAFDPRFDPANLAASFEQEEMIARVAPANRIDFITCVFIIQPPF